MNIDNKGKPIIILIIKILIGCSIYSLLSYFIQQPNYSGLSLLENAVRHIAVSSALFFLVLIFSCLIFLCIAKFPRENRNKPIWPFINFALIMTCVILAVSLYGNWKANKYMKERSYEQSTSQDNYNRDEINEYVKKMVDEQARKAPFYIDKNTYFRSAMYSNEKVYYQYTIENVAADNVDKPKFTKLMSQFIHNSFCTDPDTKFVRENAKHIDYQWEYSDKKGNVILQYEMGPNDCNTEKLSEIKPVIATITIQNSEGITEFDFNQSLLDTFESWTIETLIKKGKRSYADNGYDPDNYDPDIDTNSVYIDANGKRLAVIKININNFVRMVVIIGIKKDQIYRVNCLRNSNHDIPLWSGNCGDKVLEAFGVSMQQN